MQVGEKLGSRVQLLGASAAGVLSTRGEVLVHRLLVRVVHGHHAAASEVESVGRSKEGEETLLHHLVVEHSGLAGLQTGLLGVTVLELATDGAVAGSDGNTAGEGGTSLEDDGRTDPGEGAVDEGGGADAAVLGRLGVDNVETRKHVDVGDLDLVQEHESVVHRADH